MFRRILGCMTFAAIGVMAQGHAAQTGAANGTGSGSGVSAAESTMAALAAEAAAANRHFNDWLFVICSAMVVAMAGYRIVLEFGKHVRTLACLTSDTQRYFSVPSEPYALFKKHVLYAPVFRKRHNREFQLSSAVNMGTLPTRLQLLFLVSYLGTNVAFCVASIHWDQSFNIVAGELRNRTGILAVVNMIPLFILAARNSPFIIALGISFDTFNLLHRWFGRIVVLESLVHTFSWFASVVQPKGSWAGVLTAITKSPMMMFGFIAVCALAAISVQAMSVVRHAFYETFKSLHMALVILAIIGIWFHLKLADLEMQLHILMVVIAIWCLDRFLRVSRIVYRNFGSGSGKACLELLPGNAVRVTVDLARPWGFKPGQHAYLYMPTIGLWQSHPFSVAWSEEAENFDKRKGMPTSRQDILAFRKTRISFVVRARTGFTNKLFSKAEAAPDGKFFTKCWAEGPYGGLHSMDSYGTVMLIAGGIGITHQVPFVRHLVGGFATGSLATRKVVLVWIIQSPEHLEWIRPWMTEILAMDRRRDVLRIMLFISRPRSTKEIHSPSATVQMFPGRPSIETLLDMEIENQVGSLGVSVCGSGALSDDVRLACRKRQLSSNIDFIEESFSW